MSGVIPGGLEQAAKTTGKPGVAQTGGAESGAPDALGAFIATLTAEQRERLAELLNAPPVPR